jgi:hypothetical protein
VVEACTDIGVRERSPQRDERYFAFIDPSGGSADSMTLAIGHRERDMVLLDCLRERQPPFSPEAVVAEFAETMRSYRVRQAEGDRYAGAWPRERFGEHGIEYRSAARPKSELYQAMMPLLNSGRVRLLDIDRLRQQLAGLERRTSRGGRDSIDHAPGAHDDVANAVAGLAHRLAERREAETIVYTNPFFTGRWERISPRDEPEQRVRVIYGPEEVRG